MLLLREARLSTPGIVARYRELARIADLTERRPGWKARPKTKLLWNESDLGREKFGVSDRKKRLMSRAFAKCSRGRDGHLIPSASEIDDQDPPTLGPNLHVVRTLHETGLVAFATYLLRLGKDLVDNTLLGRSARRRALHVGPTPIRK